jgi:hypothetical protein
MKIITIAFTIFISFTSALKADVTITFEKTDCPNQICGSGRSIYVDGEIGPDDANRLESEIVANGSPAYSTVYFNSPGGSLFAGIEIGRLIRKYEYNTAIGTYSANSGYYDNGADCFSACTLAYLGGVFRYVSDKSIYGVHRFYSQIQTGEAEQSAQVASGAIISFLKDMEISSDFFIEMTKAGPDSIKLIPANQMLTMGLSNNGSGPTTWSINASQDNGSGSFLYLKGERNTVFGVNKIIFACSSSRDGIAMHVIYDPQGRDEEAKRMLAITIALDDMNLDLSNNLEGQIEIVNGWANATFSIPDRIWSLVPRSQEISVFFQAAKDAPIFLGINAMPLNGAKDLISGLSNTCAK